MAHVARTPPPRAFKASKWLFPDPNAAADEHGVVGLGGDLEPATLADAYRRGLFPWPHEGSSLPWFSPDPRGIIPLDRWRVSRSLRQTMRRSGWETTLDHAFAEVAAACAHRIVVDGATPDGTWITEDMRHAYVQLHRAGWAHSVEVWDGNELVGGLYGVLVGSVFTGESMFHRRTGASKVALFDLIERMREAHASLIDVQLMTDHLASLGATPVPRRLYLEILEELREDDVRLRTDRLPVARLADPCHARWPD